jgi:pimeloyl-ACP methyl ester carboxylesterase
LRAIIIEFVTVFLVFVDSGSEQRTKMKKPWRWVRNIILTVVSLAIVLAFVGNSYQVIQTHLDARRFPMKGRLIDVGGHKLNINCTGAGAPTVVLETGLETLAMSWEKVQPGIEKFTRVCVYDRAGYGWSEAGPLPRTSLQIAKELHQLLRNAGEKPPYLLVGVSSGGMHVRVFNGLYPNDVAGMVLVDSSVEDQWNEMPPDIQQWWAKASREYQDHLKAQAWLDLFGIARLKSNEQSQGGRLSLQPKFALAVRSESANFDEDSRELKGLGTLGDKPLIVLTAGKDTADPEHLPEGITKSDLEDFDHIWRNVLQAKLARLSTNGKQVIVKDSSHNIPGQSPEAVVTAVQEVCTTVREHEQTGKS